MSQKTKIEWTDTTWNPTRGCRRVSTGCERCYAEKLAGRFCGERQPYEGLVKRTNKGARWTGEGKFVESLLDEPLRWRKPRRVFVNSMSDLFFEEFSFEQIAAVFGAMAGAPMHTFQVLTKRPERMSEFFEWLTHELWHRYPMQADMPECGPLTVLQELANEHLEAAGSPKCVNLGQDWPLSNVWLGVSAENQETADERLPILQSVPAALRFVSAEPLLSDIQFADLTGIDWVIVGGESGAKARPLKLSWVASIIGQVHRAGGEVFVKQLGRHWARTNNAAHKKGGDPEEWSRALRVRDFPVDTRLS